MHATYFFSRILYIISYLLINNKKEFIFLFSSLRYIREVKNPNYYPVSRDVGLIQGQM